MYILDPLIHGAVTPCGVGEPSFHKQAAAQHASVALWGAWVWPWQQVTVPVHVFGIMRLLSQRPPAPKLKTSVTCRLLAVEHNSITRPAALMIAQGENVSPGRPCVCVVNAMTGEMLQVDAPGGSVLHECKACALLPTRTCCDCSYKSTQLIACISACNNMELNHKYCGPEGGAIVQLGSKCLLSQGRHFNDHQELHDNGSSSMKRQQLSW